MPLASNLPFMTGSQGLESGFNMGSKMLQQLLARQQLEQQGSQFQQQQALREKQAALQAELFPMKKQLTMAQVQQALSNARKAQALGDIYAGAGGGSPYSNQTSQPQPVQQPQQQNGEQSFMQSTPFNQEAPDFGQSQNDLPGAMPLPEEVVVSAGDPNRIGMDRLAGMPGFPKIDTKVQDGMLIKSYPSGRVTSTPIGLQPGEKKRVETMGAIPAKSYEKATDTLANLDSIQSNLDHIVDVLQDSPNANNLIGPINQHLAKFFGNPTDQAAVGQIMSATGNIVLDAAKDIKGAFTGRDQTLINSMKPNAGDPYFVFLGKTKGMAELNRMTQNRLSKYADYLSEGMAPHKALSKAREETDFSNLAPKVSGFVKNAERREMIKSGKNPTFESKEDAIQFLNGLPVQERIKLLRRGF